MQVFICLTAFVVLAKTKDVLTSEPLSPTSYQNAIAQGFATNWFKAQEPLAKYNPKNIEDIHARGFRNVRLRSKADLYSSPFNTSDFAWFLGNLTVVVDKCLEVGVIPIISWIHHRAEAYASEADRRDYVTWWTAVANQLRDKDYRLSFNLFTELGIDGCGSNCSESLRRRPDKYNRWTSDVVTAIRATGGKNAKRILILGSPGKTAKALGLINQTIYQNDPYLMAEWHIYASGPNKKEGSQKYWSGDGTGAGKENVLKAIRYAVEFTNTSNLVTYLGAWMPADNAGGSLTEAEVINFARFFTSELQKEKIPWSLNVLDRYYDTRKSEWITDVQDVAGRALNMSKVLENIKESAAPTSPHKNGSSSLLHTPLGTWGSFLSYIFILSLVTSGRY
ncbi:hypothetical protein QZH41_003338 [Actinostola sp. cb2023]|nr:hypothetical protein QZH41_003338 [Actinostola sp. cb2023]